MTSDREEDSRHSNKRTYHQDDKAPTREGVQVGDECMNSCRCRTHPSPASTADHAAFLYVQQLKNGSDGGRLSGYEVE